MKKIFKLLFKKKDIDLLGIVAIYLLGFGVGIGNVWLVLGVAISHILFWMLEPLFLGKLK